MQFYVVVTPLRNGGPEPIPPGKTIGPDDLDPKEAEALCELGALDLADAPAIDPAEAARIAAEQAEAERVKAEKAAADKAAAEDRARDKAARAATEKAKREAKAKFKADAKAKADAEAASSEGRQS